MATLAEFKRLAQKGAKIRGGYFFRTPQNTIKDLEWRTITKVQSNGIKIDGSFLDFPKANNSEFDGRTLKIFEVGYRKLTEEEKAVLAEWKKITDTEEYKKQAEIDIMTDTNLCYFRAKKFFSDRGLEYLHDRYNHNKHLDDNRYNRGEEYCVYDTNAHHGKQIAEYEIKKLSN